MSGLSAEVSEPGSVDLQSNPFVVNEKPELGLFYSTANEQIAQRIRNKFSSYGWKLNLCDFLNSASPLEDIIEEFFKENFAVFWLATDASLLKDCGVMKCIREIGFIEISKKTTVFMFFIPAEYLKITLPLVWQASTPFKEDEFFEKRFNSTLTHISKLFSQRSMSCNNLNSPAAAITGHSSTSLDPPSSYQSVETQESGSETGAASFVGLKAKIRLQEEEKPERLIQQDPSIDNQQATVIYNIQVTGNNNSIQVGSENVLYTNDTDSPME